MLRSIIGVTSTILHCHDVFSDYMWKKFRARSKMVKVILWPIGFLIGISTFLIALPVLIVEEICCKLLHLLYKRKQRKSFQSYLKSLSQISSAKDVAEVYFEGKKLKIERLDMAHRINGTEYTRVNLQGYIPDDTTGLLDSISDEELLVECQRRIKNGSLGN